MAQIWQEIVQGKLQMDQTFIQKLLRFIAVCLIQVLTITALTVPRMATAEEFRARWIKRPVSTYVSVAAPAEIWTPMIRARKANLSDIYSYEYRNNDRWMTMGRDEVALLPGFTSAQLSTLMTAPPRGSSFVFARYVPKESRLSINAIKVEEGIDGFVTVFQSYFTPHHGSHWAASRAYLTDEEKLDLGRAGRNPFENFLPNDRTDPSFRNIGWDAAMVAIGLAMQYHRAPFSIMNVENLRMATHTTKRGSFLKKKTTIHVNGYAVPSWFVGIPSTIQTWGTAAAMCVVRTPPVTDPATGQPSTSACPDPNLVAYSGVSFDEWKGGSFPMAEEHIYHWEKTSGGFTVIFFTILIMVAAFFVGPAIFAALQGGAGAVGAAAATSISGWTAAAVAGAAYAGGTLLTTSGPASLTSVKQGVFGTVGDGTMNAAGSGSDQEREATDILVQKHIESSLDNLLESPQGGLSAVTPDPANASFGSGQKAMRSTYRYCKENLRLKGQALRDCIVPGSLPVDIPH